MKRGELRACLSPKILFFLALAIISTSLFAQTKRTVGAPQQIDPEPFGDASRHWYGIYDKANVIFPKANQPRYKPTELAAIADNILLYQKDNGGWPKNYDIFAILTPDQKDSLVRAKNILNTTFDNGTTYTQVAALAQVYSAVNEPRYKEAALKGFDFICSAQYANGGWPQYYPLEENYSRHITFNDGAMMGIMQLLKDVVDDKSDYRFVDDAHRRKIETAYTKGLSCILKTQIDDTGKLTAWCQQHDEVTLQPAWARKFEPPSICNGESSEIALFLMSIERPGKDIVNAVQSAVTWFEESRILHTRVKVIQAPPLQTPYRVSTTDRVVVDDPNAPPIWTRYYELKTHRPLFCNRDSKVVYSLAEVDRERRDGYAWYTYAPQKVLEAYPAWQKKYAPAKDVLAKQP